MKSHVHHVTKHGLRIVAGWLFIFLGIIGLFLPILQGILFLAIGVYLLAPYIPLFHRIKVWFFHRYPALEQRIHRLHDKFSNRHSS